MIRAGRFLSHTHTSSIVMWKNGYEAWGMKSRSKWLQRYVASCVSTQKRKSGKTSAYSRFSRSSSSASYSSSSSVWDMRVLLGAGGRRS